MMLGSAGFAAYQSGATVPPEQASAVATANPTIEPTTSPSSPPVTFAPPSPFRPPEVTGRVSTSGPFDLSYDGAVNITSELRIRSCADLADGAFLIAFSNDRRIGPDLDHLRVSVSLPNGTYGPGTYNLASTRLSADGSWQREGIYNQLWSVKPGLSRATLQLNSDASGMIAVTDLTPQNGSQITAPANLQKRLNFTLTFTCS
jgi:hypothetical protein